MCKWCYNLILVLKGSLFWIDGENKQNETFLLLLTYFCKMKIAFFCFLLLKMYYLLKRGKTKTTPLKLYCRENSCWNPVSIVNKEKRIFYCNIVTSFSFTFSFFSLLFLSISFCQAIFNQIFFSWSFFNSFIKQRTDGSSFASKYQTL